MTSMNLGTNQDEPRSYKEAIKSPDWPNWQTVMGNEMDQLKKQKTWDLVDLPPNKKALKTRQVYKIKTDQNNQIIKQKARWVVKGFTQQYGIDYEETFANIYRPEVYKMLLYLAAHHNWEIVQWDFKNAFTHADIDKELYIEQLEGFTTTLNKVYKLNKAIYGLTNYPSKTYILYFPKRGKQYSYKVITY